jgi:endonuclease/exonuclease/phosphatase family metal-dependent hydrolase
MIRNLLPVLLITCIPWATPAIAQDTRSLSVMTFNIRYNNPDDSIYSWDQRKQMVFHVLQSEHPDIIGFQEALNGQVAELVDEMEGYEWTGVGRDDGKTAGEFVPVFFNSGIFKKKESGTFWLSETPDIPGSVSWKTACTRIVTWVRLKEKSSGMEFFVFNTHFDHVSGLARERSAGLLLSRIGQLAGDLPVIVTGDFNATPSDRAYKILTGTLKDTRSAAPEQDSAYTFVGFPAKPDPGNVIDFIFVKPLKNTRIEQYRIIDYHEGDRFPSDHLPVSVRIQWD